MLFKSKAVIIKSTRFSETSIITRLYTQSHGVLSFHVPGVYSRKSSFKPSYFQPLQIVEIDFYYRQNKNLLKLREIRIVLSSQHLSPSVNKTALAMIISEVIYKTVKEEEKNENLFRFLYESISLLHNSDGALHNFLLFFLLHYTYYIGFSPSGRYSDHTPVFNLLQGRFTAGGKEHELTMSKSESLMLSDILELKMQDFNSIKTEPEQRHQLLNHLISYYEIHISGFSNLNSYTVLREVFLSASN